MPVGQRFLLASDGERLRLQRVCLLISIVSRKFSRRHAELMIVVLYDVDIA